MPTGGSLRLVYAQDTQDPAWFTENPVDSNAADTYHSASP